MSQPFNGSLTIEGREIRYRVTPNTRARVVRLRIGAEPVVLVTVPARQPSPDVKTLLSDHRAWIFKHLDRLAAPDASLEDGTGLLFAGTERRLCLLGGRVWRVVVAADELRVYGGTHGEDLRGRLESWYRSVARSAFEQRIQHWSNVLGVSPTKLTIRDQRTRWGSCSNTGSLNFNWRLVAAPPSVLDYVVVHELAHILEHNHSPAFWAIVGTQIPDYGLHRRWLHDHGYILAALLRPAQQ